MTYSVAVSGASGYAGGEILRILAAHPDVEIRTVTAHSNAGQPLIQHQPHLRSLAHLTLSDTTPEVLAGHDIVFLALPHGQSGQYTDALADTPLVIDAGADHRLESAADWDRFYAGDFHDPWTYGVPELPVAGSKQRERLVGATRIAAPGCNASTVSLSLAPGRRGGRHRPGRHRHRPRRRTERRRQGAQAQPARQRDPRVGEPLLGRRHAPSHPGDPPGAARRTRVGGQRERRRYPPRMLRHRPDSPMQKARATSASPSRPSWCRWRGASSPPRPRRSSPGASDADIRGAWEAAYGDETFVQLLPAGDFPRTADVLGANTALMGLAIDRAANRVVVVTAVDNLVKGTAGAAIQSMNIALGLAEGTALSVNGVAP